ncbi:unnamed protein product [Arctia plantaginis]|uniref:Peptidase S1 domain-containing protein n=1 Tax=Arctia plantaginis TaxID=874455 RepID=A0A8S1BUE3_ARCPL|nr:unnamed protein product [Arctia plantaginis]
MHLITLLAVCIAAVAASPETFEPSQRIVGGTVTTINQWPFQANVMAGSGNNFRQWCGGTIVNNRNILSAAHCVRAPTMNLGAHQMRLRLGSTWASSGGVVHNIRFKRCSLCDYHYGSSSYAFASWFNLGQ